MHRLPTHWGHLRLLRGWVGTAADIVTVGTLGAAGLKVLGVI
jgi:hypothetical protein